MFREALSHGKRRLRDHCLDIITGFPCELLELVLNGKLRVLLIREKMRREITRRERTRERERRINGRRERTHAYGRGNGAT
jgi:hypothetical protein